MVSNDVQYVTVDMFNAGIAEIKEEIQRNNEQIRAEILVLDRKVDLLNAQVLGVNERIDDIKFYVSVVFGVLAVVVALAALFPAITAIVRLLRRSAPSEDRIQAMIDASVSRAMQGK